MIARKFALLIVVATVGLLVGAFAVRELRSPERTIVDPIEIDSGDDEALGRDRPRKPKRPKPPDAKHPPAPREEDSGADPAPAPPAPAGDDDGDDDDESESDDDDGDD